MARSNQQEILNPGEGGAPQGPLAMGVPDEDEDTPLDRVLTMLQGSPSDRATVKLYRKTPANPRGEWCADYSVQDFAENGMKLIREQWGPGSYHVWLYGPHPVSGKVARLAYETVNIAEPLNANPAPVGAQQLQVPNSNSEMSQVLRMLAEGQNAILQALTTRPDATAEMQKTISLMAAMRDAMGLNVAPAAPVAVAAPKGLIEQLQELKAAREVLRELSADEDKGDPSDPMKMLPSILEIVKTSMAGRGTTPANVVPAITTPPSLENGAPAAPIEGTDDVNALQLTILKSYIRLLLNMASTGKPASDGGGFIYEKLPDEMVQFLKDPSWFDALSHFEPAVIPHRTWFEAAKVEADKLFAEDEGAT